MGKILVFVSIIFTVATAFFGYINKGHLSETSQKLDSTKESLSKTTTQLAKAEKELKATKDFVLTWSAEKEQLASQITSLKGELDKTKSELSTQSSKVTEKTAEIDAKLAENTALKATVDEFKSKGTGSDSKVKELETQITENKTIIDTLTEQKNAAQAKVTALSRKDSERKDIQRKNNFSGRVLAVNQAWNFVVLNLGDRNGLVSNVELLVKRGTQLVGKVRVTSVEPATSIADIVASNIPGGLRLQPNDQVISINEEVKE